MDTPTGPVDNQLKRRHFLQALGGAAAGATLVASADDGPITSNAAASGTGDSDGTATAATAATADTTEYRSASVIPELTDVAELQPADEGEVHMTYAPEVPPATTRTDQRIVEFELDSIESEAEIDPDNGVRAMVWGFRMAGDDAAPRIAPGPVMRARVGDMCKITVNNLADSTQPHNIDWHTITGQGGGAEATTVAPGESATIYARLLYPGVYMYHCAVAPVPRHISHGMYGMFIVDPEEPLPEVDHEWAVMQSEWYLGEPDEDGYAEHDEERLLYEHPSHVVFNGAVGALAGDNTLEMEVGQRSRIYMVNEGLNLDSNFHPIGSQWDVVYPEGATHAFNRVIRGSQSTLVVAGGGTVVEMVGYVPSTIVLVDHALVRTFYKGCLGTVVISGEPNGAIFAESEEEMNNAAPVEAEGDETDAAAAAPSDPNTVNIPDGAWDPANADMSYTPGRISVPVGTTITWHNNDTVIHTVTAGTSNGTVGTPNGLFDSGNMDPGVSWEHTFDRAGTYDYYCTPHPWMIGVVEVTDG